MSEGKHKQKKQRTKKGNKKRSQRNSGFPFLPDVKLVSMNYVSRSQVSGTSYSVYNFDGTTLQTLQPTYRDQLLAIWNQYVVMGVTIEAKIVNRSSTVDAEVLDYFGDGFTVSGLTFNQALEYKHTRRVLLSTAGNQKVVTLRRKIMFSQYLPPKFWDDSRFWGTATTGPSYSTDRGFQHAIGFLAADGTSSIAVTMDRKIIFHVRLFTLAAITNSLTETQFPPTLNGVEDQTEPEKPLPKKPEPIPVKPSAQTSKVSYRY